MIPKLWNRQTITAAPEHPSVAQLPKSMANPFRPAGWRR